MEKMIIYDCTELIINDKAVDFSLTSYMVDQTPWTLKERYWSTKDFVKKVMG